MGKAQMAQAAQGHRVLVKAGLAGEMPSLLTMAVFMAVVAPEVIPMGLRAKVEAVEV
jgi:hypothetical protein